MSEETYEQKPESGVADAGDVAAPGRRRFIATGAMLGAAGLFLGKTPLGPTPGQADLVRDLKRFLYLDPIVMNFAYEMEDLQKEFFANATLSNAFNELTPHEQYFFCMIANEDAEHYEAIKFLRERTANEDAGSSESPNRAGSQPPRMFNFPGRAFNHRAGLYEVALHIKETSLFAYHGAVDLVAKDTLRLAAAIAGVEGRHVAMLREMWGVDPVPSPFEASLGAMAAGKALSKYGFHGGGRDGVTKQYGW